MSSRIRTGSRKGRRHSHSDLCQTESTQGSSLHSRIERDLVHRHDDSLTTTGHSLSADGALREIPSTSSSNSSCSRCIQRQTRRTLRKRDASCVWTLNEPRLYLSLLLMVTMFVFIFFSDRYTKLENENSVHDQIQLEQISQRQTQQNTFRLKISLPVIAVGYPKSGTTSINRFFKCASELGATTPNSKPLRVQHFCCCDSDLEHPPCDSMATCILANMAHNNSNRKLLEGCGTYEIYGQIDGERPLRYQQDTGSNGVLMNNGTVAVVGQGEFRNTGDLMMHFLPQHFELARLSADYPSATFLLPLRDPHAWAESVFQWFNMRGRVINEYVLHNTSLARPGKKRAREFLANIYQEHSEYVRTFCQTHDRHTCIEVNITHSEAGIALAEAAFESLPLNSATSTASGATGVEECWGHHNKIGSRAKNNATSQVK